MGDLADVRGKSLDSKSIQNNFEMSKVDTSDSDSDSSDEESLGALLTKARSNKKRKRQLSSDEKREKNTKNVGNFKKSKVNSVRRGSKKRLLNFLETEKPEILFKVGTLVEALWEGEWCPATVSSVDDDVEEGLTFSVSWLPDNSTTSGITVKEIRLSKNVPPEGNDEAKGDLGVREHRKTAANESLRLFAGVEAEANSVNSSSKTVIITKKEMEEKKRLAAAQRAAERVHRKKTKSKVKSDVYEVVFQNQVVCHEYMQGFVFTDQTVYKVKDFKMTAVTIQDVDAVAFPLRSFSISKKGSPSDIKQHSYKIEVGDAVLAINGVSASSKTAQEISTELSTLPKTESSNLPNETDKKIIVRFLRKKAVLKSLPPLILDLEVPPTAGPGSTLEFMKPGTQTPVQVIVPAGMTVVSVESDMYSSIKKLSTNQIYYCSKPKIVSKQEKNMKSDVKKIVSKQEKNMKSDVKNTQNLNNSNKGQMVLEKMKLGVHSAFNDKCIDNILDKMLDNIEKVNSPMKPVRNSSDKMLDNIEKVNSPMKPVRNSSESQTPQKCGTVKRDLNDINK